MAKIKYWLSYESLFIGFMMRQSIQISYLMKTGVPCDILGTRQRCNHLHRPFLIAKPRRQQWRMAAKHQTLKEVNVTSWLSSTRQRPSMGRFTREIPTKPANEKWKTGTAQEGPISGTVSVAFSVRRCEETETDTSHRSVGQSNTGRQLVFG